MYGRRSTAVFVMCRGKFSIIQNERNISSLVLPVVSADLQIELELSILYVLSTHHSSHRYAYQGYGQKRAGYYGKDDDFEQIFEGSGL